MIEIPINGISKLYVKATATAGYSGVILLKESATGLSDGDSAVYATGETKLYIISRGEESVINIPSDCAYVEFVRTYNSDTNRLPTAVISVSQMLSDIIGTGASYFTGKKMVVCGHSFAAGTWLDNLNDAWPCVAAKKLGMSVQNVACGGSNIAKLVNSYSDDGGPFDNGVFFSIEEFQAAEDLDTTKQYLVKDSTYAATSTHPFRIYIYDSEIEDDFKWKPKYNYHDAAAEACTPVVDIAEEMDADAGLIIIAAGANDYDYNPDHGETYLGIPLGTMTDNTKYTFYGALHILLQNLIQKYDGVPIIFTDSCARWPLSGEPVANRQGFTYWDYKNAILEVCHCYSIPFIDCGFECNIPRHTMGSKWYAQPNVLTNGHLSKIGHERIGQFVAGKIVNYLVE